jgi:nucleoid-associated protein YgaU
MSGIYRTLFGFILLSSLLFTQAQSDLQAQLEAALAKISSLESRLATEQTALSSLRVKFVQEVAAREAKLAELNTVSAPTTTSGAQDRLNRSLVRNAQLSARIRELEKTAEVAAKVPELETSNAALSQRLATEQKAVADLRIKLVQDISAREDKIKQADANYAALGQRLATEQQALSALRVKYVQDLAAAKAAPTTAQTDTSQCRAQSNALNSLITSLSAQNASLRTAQSATPVVEETQAAACVLVSNSGQLKSLNTLITSLSNQNSGLRAQVRQLLSTQSAPSTTTTSGYVIKAGDTLSSIALSLYGDAERWRDIANANGISDRETINLEIGQVINIP